MTKPSNTIIDFEKARQNRDIAKAAEADKEAANNPKDAGPKVTFTREEFDAITGLRKELPNAAADYVHGFGPESAMIAFLKRAFDPDPLLVFLKHEDDGQTTYVLTGPEIDYMSSNKLIDILDCARLYLAPIHEENKAKNINDAAQIEAQKKAVLPKTTKKDEGKRKKIPSFLKVIK